MRAILSGVVTLVVLGIIGAEWLGSHHTTYDSYAFGKTVTQSDVTSNVGTSVVLGVVVLLVVTVLSKLRESMNISVPYRYPTALLGAYSLVASLATFSHLYPKNYGYAGGWRGPLLESVAVAAWAWLALACVLVVLATFGSRPWFRWRLVVVAFALAAAAIVCGLAFQA